MFYKKLENKNRKTHKFSEVLLQTKLFEVLKPVNFYAPILKSVSRKGGCCLLNNVSSKFAIVRSS